MNYYYCGNEEEIHTMTQIMKGVNRNTKRGSGIPKRGFNNAQWGMMFGKIRKRRKCILCNFERGKYGRFRVFRDVASMR